MELYIGGFAQGKLEYVLREKGEVNIVQEVGEIKEYSKNQSILFYQFHEWFRQEIEQGRNPEEEMDAIFSEYKNLLIISDEVGNGIIPVEAVEREYRERLGRYLCRIAARSERVERILCGIGQRIK